MKIVVQLEAEEIAELIRREIDLRFNMNIWRVTDGTYPYRGATVTLTNEPEVKLEEFGNAEHGEAADNANP